MRNHARAAEDLEETISLVTGQTDYRLPLVALGTVFNFESGPV